MTKMPANLSLLPNGFEDLLYPDAARETKAVGTVMGLLNGFGYNRIKPPKIEFEDTLLSQGIGDSLSDKTFRVMDPISHKMMAFCSDMTVQVARIAQTRLAKNARPLRLCYAGNVIRTRVTEQRTERQFFQVGAEIIGMNEAQAEIETAVLSALALARLEVKDITIDINLPGLVEDLFDDYKIADSKHDKARKALAKRDAGALKSLNEELYKAIENILSQTGNSDDLFPTLFALPEKYKEHIERLKIVYEALHKAIKELGVDKQVSITIDPLETLGYMYHTGLSFSLYAAESRRVLGRGGRYNLGEYTKDQSESAVGFTLYMDAIRKIIPKAGEKECIEVDFESSWDTLMQYVDAGKRVVRK